MIQNALTQVQIIKSLGDALAWFEREIEWGTPPGELSHLTGRIGELYVAMITQGQMADRTNQRGYDVVSAKNERISVKTITSSVFVSFNPKTLDEVDRAIVLRINVSEEDGISIEELFDIPSDEIALAGKPYEGKIRIATSGAKIQARDLTQLKVVASAKYERHEIQQLENATIRIKDIRTGEFLATVKPRLREIADELGVDIYYGEGKVKNTRQLGAHVLRALAEG